jgi:hypothetical protein
MDRRKRETAEEGGGARVEEEVSKVDRELAVSTTRCLPTGKRGDQNLALVSVHARASASTVV